MAEEFLKGPPEKLQAVLNVFQIAPGHVVEGKDHVPTSLQFTVLRRRRMIYLRVRLIYSCLVSLLSSLLAYQLPPLSL
jgi:hypothetical protein